MGGWAGADGDTLAPLVVGERAMGPDPAHGLTEAKGADTSRLLKEVHGVAHAQLDRLAGFTVGVSAVEKRLDQARVRQRDLRFVQHALDHGGVVSGLLELAAGGDQFAMRTAEYEFSDVHLVAQYA